MNAYSDSIEARKQAKKSLRKFKKIEAKKKGDMYTWTRKKAPLCIISHTNRSRLEEIVEKLGYE